MHCDGYVVLSMAEYYSLWTDAYLRSRAPGRCAVNG